jgi:hypothetical protein
MKMQDTLTSGVISVYCWKSILKEQPMVRIMYHTNALFGALPGTIFMNYLGLQFLARDLSVERLD